MEKQKKHPQVRILPKQETFKVAGVFSTGFVEFDQNIIYLNINDVLSIFDKENTDQNIIGVEPLLNGQCNLADYCLNNFVKNIYIYTDPVQIFFKKYPKLKFNCCYILFPDPWHKKKHNKRRLINPEFLQKLVVRAKIVYFLSDNYDYYLNVKSSALKLKKVKIVLSSKKFKTANTKYLLRAKRLRNKLYYLTIDKE